MVRTKHSLERFTDRARVALQLGEREARQRNYEYVGTEHLLLGLMRSDDSFPTQLLMNYGLSAENVRDEVLRLLNEPWEEKLSRHWLGWCPRCRVEMIRGDATVTHSASGWLSALIARGLSRGGLVFTPREEGPMEVISAKQSRAAWRCTQCGVIVIAGE